jgi:hypothetical protein
VNEELGLTYYGSTIQELSNRLAKHKYDAKKNNKYTSSELFQKGEVKIILVEDCPCNEKIDLLKRERFYIENNECVNKLIPTRTQKEWKQTNIEKVKIKSKELYEKNKQKISDYQNTKFNCICGGKYIRVNKLRHERSKKHQTFLNT